MSHYENIKVLSRTHTAAAYGVFNKKIKIGNSNVDINGLSSFAVLTRSLDDQSERARESERQKYLF